MCKIMMVPHIPQGKELLASEFIKAAAKPMSAVDRDGLGYAGISDSGELFGEVWLKNSDAFKPLGDKHLDAKVLNQLGGNVIKLGLEGLTYRRHGKVNPVKAVKRARSLMIHTRAATCTKAIENTHPFFRDDSALIHNGVIWNTEELDNVTSTCDSETILNAYVDLEVPAFPKHMETLAQSLKGWYAVAILTKVETRWYMDIFKESRSQLHCAYVKELGTTVFCTSEAILRKTAKACRMHLSNVFAVKHSRMIRIDVLTGELVLTVPFEPNTETARPVLSYSGYSIEQGGVNTTSAWDKLRDIQDADRSLAEAYRDALSKDEYGLGVDELITRNLKGEK